MMKNFLKKLFYKKPKIDMFEAFMRSEKFIKSNYEVHKVNDKFALYDKSTSKYVDLTNYKHKWSISSSFIMDCIGTKEQVIYNFNLLNPEVVKIYPKEIG